MPHLYTAVEQEIEIRDTGGALADPDTLTVRLVAPDGTQIDYVYGVDTEVTRSSTGVYVFESFPLDQVTRGNKLWWVVWLATGTGVTVSDEASVEICALHASFA